MQWFKFKLQIIFVALILFLFIAVIAYPKPIENTPVDQNPQTQNSVANRRQVKVTSVVDGDTVEIEGGQKLRYIGIDTPETKDPNRPVGCYGKEASEKNKELVLNKIVELEKDVSETDKYGRLLRYVYLDGQMVNELLVKEGFAKASSYPPDIEYQDLFRAAEKTARENNLGLWGLVCENWVAAPKPTVSTTTITPVTNLESGCKYDCAGEDKDCADFTTHNQAQSFFDCCGFSITYDPMNLDAVKEGDGVACESLP